MTPPPRLMAAWEEMVGGSDALTSLRAARDLKEAVGTYEIDLARAALASGETWESIGAALGVSRQAAWERLRRGIADAIEADRSRVAAERDRLEENRRQAWKKRGEKA